tara:strand:+ start:342 stop:632 length:291 start_codon:yes stop_codon:yes gene_type:complete
MGDKFCDKCSIRQIENELDFLRVVMTVLKTTQVTIEYIEQEENIYLPDDKSKLNQAMIRMRSVVDDLSEIAVGPYEKHIASLHEIAEKYGTNSKHT